MSLSKLKKAELVTLAAANDIELDDDLTKDGILEELEAAGVTFEVAKVETKAERQARLLTRDADDVENPKADRQRALQEKHAAA